MAVEVKFGNLGIDAIERDLGIKFTEEDRKRAWFSHKTDGVAVT